MNEEEKTREIIDNMILDKEAQSIIREYRNNKTLIGKVRFLNANKTRFKNAKYYTEHLSKSMKEIRDVSEQLKQVLKSHKGKKMKHFTKTMDNILSKFDKQQDEFAATIEEIDDLFYRNNINDDDDNDDNDNGDDDIKKIEKVRILPHAI